MNWDDLASDIVLLWTLNDQQAACDKAARVEAEHERERVEHLERDVADLKRRIAELQGRL